MVAVANCIMERPNLITKGSCEMLSSVAEYWAFVFLRNMDSLNVLTREGNFLEALCPKERFYNVTFLRKTSVGKS